MSDPVWQKSSYSGDDEADCVELAASQGTRTLLRESDEPGTVIETTGPGLAALIRAIRGLRY